MTMIKTLSCLLFLLFSTKSFGFSTVSLARRTTTASLMSSNSNMDERMKQILQEEAYNPENLKASAEELKNLKPEQLDDILKNMDNMPAAQRQQLQSMGMDPEMMKQSLQMMKENPQMMKDMGEMMKNMSPKQLVEQSRKAQENMKQMNSLIDNPMAATTPSTTSPAIADAEIVSEDDEEDEEDDDEEDEEEENEEEPIEPDAQVLDAMFKVGEIMSPPADKSGVTYPAFCSLPPIAVLTGDGPDDTPKSELTELWNKGSLGATRVDRQGLERIWRLVQENYYNDIVEEAQDRLVIKKKKAKRGSATKPVASTPPPLSPSTPVVGANIDPNLLKEQLKSMKDEDLTQMFEQMSNMGPEEEARLKAMGADPAMLKKSAAMMKNNPLLRKAATMMMKNTPADQLMKASQEAQQKMANMTEEEKKRIMDQLQQDSK